MPTNNTQGGQQGGGQNMKFVPRFEMAVMQYVILSKAQQGEVTRENLQQTFRGNMQMSSDHLDHCIQQLVQDGHLKEVGGNKYTATDDGREDVQKLTQIVLELPNVVHQGGGQRQGQQQMTGGRGTTGTTGGPSGSSTGSQGPGASSMTGQGGGNVGGQQGGGQRR